MVKEAKVMPPFLYTDPYEGFLSLKVQLCSLNHSFSSYKSSFMCFFTMQFISISTAIAILIMQRDDNIGLNCSCEHLFKWKKKIPQWTIARQEKKATGKLGTTRSRAWHRDCQHSTCPRWVLVTTHPKSKTQPTLVSIRSKLKPVQITLTRICGINA